MQQPDYPHKRLIRIAVYVFAITLIGSNFVPGVYGKILLCAALVVGIFAMVYKSVYCYRQRLWRTMWFNLFLTVLCVFIAWFELFYLK